MESLMNGERLSFDYGGKPFSELKKEMNVTENAIEHRVEYLLPDGLKVTNIAHVYEKYGAYEWVTWFENTSDSDSDIISRLNDCDIRLPFEPDKARSMQYKLSEDVARIYNPIGSIWSRSEFASTPQTIMSGESKHFATNGGRSSQQNAPFFDIHRKGRGVLFAIGWTGQWNCTVSRNDTDIHIQTGVEDVRFKLHPGEKIRTSSIVVMPYECEQNDAHNRFRRLVKEHFSLIGQEGRDETGPLSHMFWGALTSDKMISTIKKLKQYDLGFEYVWIDAGW